MIRLLRNIFVNNGKYVIIYLFFLFKIHLSIRWVRHVVPTIAGDSEYFPSNYTFYNNDAINNARYEEALGYFKNREKKIMDPSVEIRIIASNRPKKYLTQVIGYLLHTYSNQSQPKIIICNVEKIYFNELQDFKEAFEIYNISNFIEDDSIDYYSKVLTKESKDYWSCLNISTSSRYLLLLEDDALVVPNFPNYLDSLIKQFDERREIHYAKLYHPVYLRKLPSVPLEIAAALCIAFTFSWYFFKSKFLFFYLFTAFLIYADIHSYSSQFTADIRYYLTNTVYLSHPESCCTPAVFFRSSISEKMANDLYNIQLDHGKAKDHVLDESAFYGVQTDSNMVVHIGAYSTLRPTMIRLSPSISKYHTISKWSQYFW